MRKVYAGFTGLMMVAVVAQFYLAAVGAFDSAPKDEAFGPHRMLGYMIVLLALVMTVLAAAARVPGRLIGLTALIAGLGVVQALIAAVAKAVGDGTDTSTTAGRFVFGLHALNGLAMMGTTGRVLREARALAASPKNVGSAPADVVPPA